MGIIKPNDVKTQLQTILGGGGEREKKTEDGEKCQCSYTKELVLI